MRFNSILGSPLFYQIFHRLKLLRKSFLFFLDQSAVAVEYTDCISVGDNNPAMSVHGITVNNKMVKPQ